MKKLLKNVCDKIWMDKLKLTSRGKYFVTFKNNICYEYLNHINFRNLRRVLTKLRLSDYNLMIEQGRKARIKLHVKGKLVNFVIMNTQVKLRTKYTFFLIVNGENTLHLERILSRR